MVFKILGNVLALVLFEKSRKIRQKRRITRSYLRRKVCKILEKTKSHIQPSPYELAFKVELVLYPNLKADDLVKKS